jgi:transcriptional regulator with XRE-family HTH domain
MESNKEKKNLVRYTAKRLGLTYKELGKLIGYKPRSLAAFASTGKISEKLRVKLESLIENRSYEEINNEENLLKKCLKVYGMTPKEMADYLGIPFNTLIGWRYRKMPHNIKLLMYYMIEKKLLEEKLEKIEKRNNNT